MPIKYEPKLDPCVLAVAEAYLYKKESIQNGYKTWKQFKDEVESQGMTDGMEIEIIDLYLHVDDEITVNLPSKCGAASIH